MQTQAVYDHLFRSRVREMSFLCGLHAHKFNDQAVNNSGVVKIPMPGEGTQKNVVIITGQTGFRARTGQAMYRLKQDTIWHRNFRIHPWSNGVRGVPSNTSRVVRYPSRSIL